MTTDTKQDGQPLTFGEAITLYGFREAVEMLRARYKAKS